MKPHAHIEVGSIVHVLDGSWHRAITSEGLVDSYKNITSGEDGLYPYQVLALGYSMPTGDFYGSSDQRPIINDAIVQHIITKEVILTQVRFLRPA